MCFASLPFVFALLTISFTNHRDGWTAGRPEVKMGWQGWKVKQAGQVSKAENGGRGNKVEAESREWSGRGGNNTLRMTVH